MKIYWKPLQFSLLIHGLVMLALINLQISPVRPQNILVIDFTMDNEPIFRDRSRTSAISLPVKQNRNQKNKHAVSATHHQQHKEQEPTLPPESIYIQSIPDEELQTMAMTASKANIDTKSGSNDFHSFTSQTSLSNSVLQKAGSPDRSDGHGDDVISAGKSQYLKAHFSYIKDLIHKHLIYPAFAKKMGWEGKVITSFIVSSDGCAKNVKVSKSSGYEILDENAIKAITDASPFPKPPVEAQIIIPILYRLN